MKLIGIFHVAARSITSHVESDSSSNDDKSIVKQNVEDDSGDSGIDDFSER